ncbi:unnamed protein product [Euphydryas editha]|uniref:Pro-resilin n=1 Tax=Euphydryas editha TaxID=104508 RepID=A0AAU9UHE5_EUPED|nr:unnamed protein product [Euphydryas editha]
MLKALTSSRARPNYAHGPRASKIVRARDPIPIPYHWLKGASQSPYIHKVPNKPEHLKALILRTIFIVCMVLIASSLAEPPVNRYLPPGSSRSSALSQTYGAPSFGSQTQNAVFRQPSSTYDTPSNSRPNSQYLPPSNQYSLPRTSTQYQAPRNQYLPPTSQYQAPTSQYRAPTSQYQAPSSQYQTPSNQYGLPNQGLSQSGSGVQYSAPSQEYGTPGTSRGADYQQSRQYLPPGGGYDDGSSGEPANYNFEYMVRDAYSGNDFGHRESRQGDRAVGLYYVLLPDGRKQTVEYEADQDGYKPRISYEDTGARSGYSGSQSSYNGSQSSYSGSQSDYSGSQSGYSGSQSGYSGSQSGYENQYPSGPY